MILMEFDVSRKIGYISGENVHVVEDKYIASKRVQTA